MAGVVKEEEQWRWLCVSEESLLLHDDLVRLADHIPLPTGVAVRSIGEEEYGLSLLDGKTPQELATIIHSECAARPTTFSSLMEYRLNALRCLWTALSSVEKKETAKKGEEGEGQSSAKTSQQSEMFSSRISLLLIFPTLRSLSRLDPQLSQDTAAILLQTLRNCEPVSLSKEPTDCIAGLESLLCSWIETAKEMKDGGESQLQVATSALVALTVAVGTGSLMLRTVNTLQQLSSTHTSLELLTPTVLHKLLRGHIALEEPSAIVSSSHLISWDYDTQHVEDDKDNAAPHSIAFDGQFVYITTSNGKKLIKLGSGLRGTLRSYIYVTAPIDGGWLVYCKGRLLMRRQDADEKADEPFCHEVDTNSLKMKGDVGMCSKQLLEEAHTTLHFMSDGQCLYWLYALKAVEQVASSILPEEKIKRHAVYLQTLLVKDGEAGLELELSGERVLIQRVLEEKNSEMVKSLMRSGGPYSTPALSSLLGGSGGKDEIGTSMGFTVKLLQSYACYCTGSSLVLITPPPPAGSRSLFYSSASSGSKALAVSFSYSMSSGQLVSQSDLSSTTQLHCALSRGGSTQTAASCYDSINHCVWTASDDWVDVWSCASRVRPAAHLLAVRMNHDSICSLIPPPSGDTVETISLGEAINLLVRHSGMESCRLVPSQDFSRVVSHNLSLNFLRNVCTILQSSMSERNWNNALANIVTLQAVLPGFTISHKYSDDNLSKLLSTIREVVWELVVMEECPSALLAEVRNLICKNTDHLLVTSMKKKEQILPSLSSSPSLAPLRHDLLLQTVRQLRHASGVPHLLLSTISPLICCSLTSDTLAPLHSVMTCSEEELPVVTATLPVFPPSLQCAAAFLNAALRKLTGVCSKGKEKTEEKEEEKQQRVMETARSDLIMTCQELNIFDACEKTLRELCSLASSLSPVTEEDKEVLEKRYHRLLAMERASKSTAIGCFLSPLLALASNQQLGSLSLTTTLLEYLTPLEKLVAEVCSLLYPNHQRVSIPAPWASGRMVETIHPVRDNYKFKETVSFPGARNLFLRFDSRCSSQYDYDKVLVYAGDSPKCPKIAEYGGNTHGFGSRSVLGKGWPKDLVKVDGDTVTITFEMKSGREHSTPDKAMWGFACTVRPQELAEDGSNGLPFLLDIHLSLSSVSCSLIGQLFNGAPPTKHELRCEPVMESALLQRCVWHDEGVEPFKMTSQEPLPHKVIQKLRNMAGQVQPTLRPSIRELLRVEELEAVIVDVCLRHHGIESALSLLGEGGADACQRQLLQNLFKYINGLERRLQALAELDARWKGEVAEMAADKMTVMESFFFDLLQQESSFKSFELLCCLKSVQISSGDLFAAAKTLQELLERDIERARSGAGDEDMYAQTGALVKGVIERARLLLHVCISPQTSATPPTVSRSVSTPTAASESGKIFRKQWSVGSMSTVVLVDVPWDTAHQTLLDEIFFFIGSKPEEAVSIEVFLSAAQQQRERGTNRVKALNHLHHILTSRHHLGFAVKHILACVSPVLLNGPQVKDIVCSGLVQPVRDAFAKVMQAVAKLASRQPVACINTIALLCTVPYTRDEEACLVHSGLVKLLDQLCSMSGLPKDSSLLEEKDDETDDEEEEEAVHRVTTLAWAAFQVLADRCVSWESKGSGFISSGLAQQVSLLLTNHLSRAMESLAVSETGASDTLQEALSMLLGLARSHMGRTILSQPACVSKLLLLLTDQRPSPKLVLVVLQLCRVALPLMTAADCNMVSIPHHPTLSSLSPGDNHMATSTIRLLMAKLAEYIIPITSPVPVDTTPTHKATPTDEKSPQSHQPIQEEVDESGQAAVVLYRRDNEGAADLLHMLLNQDPRQLGHRMETVLQLDHTLNEDGKVEVFTDSYRSCQRRALRWANIGFTVSIEPPSGRIGQPSGSETDRKRAKIESACRKKNMELLKTDPPRPFLSGMVAYSLASEIIALLNGLLADEEAVQVWRDAIRAVLDSSLMSVPSLIPHLAEYCSEVHSSIAATSPPPSPGELLSSACLANATFAALGGFKASIQPGMVVTVLGRGLVKGCRGTVMSISERRGVANIQFENDDLCFVSNKTLDVPLSRLCPPEVGSLPVQQLELQESLCAAIKSVLSSAPLTCKTTQAQVDASIPAMGVCRLFAELRTRVAMSLSHHSQQDGLRERLLSCCNTEQLLKQAQSCDPGQRLSVVEVHCTTLRMLYRDSSRPPPPTVENQLIEPKKFYWDISRVWPSVHSCCFSHHLSSVTYQGASTTTASSSSTTSTSSSSGSEETQTNPRGVLILTHAPIPEKAPSFYWELEVCHLDAGSNAAHITLGYCPDPQKPAEGQHWTYPEETCLLRSTGRGCQVRGEDRMQWEKVTLENPLVNGDVVGCGWVKGESGDGKGTVYFTVNGECHPTKFNAVPSRLYPFVHIQKKGTRVRANFGEHPFVYAEGYAHRQAANVPDGDTEEEIAAIFRLLPFADIDFAEIDSDLPSQPRRVEVDEDKEKEKEKVEKGAPATNGARSHKLESLTPGESYQTSSSVLHVLETSYSNMLECGPLVRPGGWGSDRGDETEEEESVSSASQDEDLHSLLVKAWEAKVFPVIQRRFRNDQERKSGLEQIRGALQLGMETIAQETVEFLYEENGGLPRDLHLPTMDDVKADLDKFTISRVKKGQVVVIRKDLPYSRCGGRAMQKTLGLTGVVLGIDQANDLVQVECYLSSEGALVRFWFPVLDLERPPKGFRKPAALKGVESTHIAVHRELLSCEAALSSMYCRSALLSLHPPSSSCSSNSWVTHFSLLASQSFSQPSVEGHVSNTSPLMATSLQSSLMSVFPSPYSLFFTNCSLLEEEVCAGLSTFSSDLHHLASGVHAGLSSIPLSFGATCLTVAEVKEKFDIVSPGSAFLVVTCPEERLKSSSGASYKFPWAKVFCSRGAHGKSGLMALQEVARYPSQLPSQQYCGPVLPSLLLPTSSCHLRLGGCSPAPGRHIAILGIPSCLPTALVFAETLSTVTCRLGDTIAKGSASLDGHLRALQTCLSSLSALLVQVDFPPVIREKLFQCVSGILWTIHSTSSSSSSLLSPGLVSSLNQELQKLYEHESGNGTATDHKPKTRQSPLPSFGSSKSVAMFSTYLQSLLELVVATELCCTASPDLASSSSSSCSSPIPPDSSSEGNNSTRRKRNKQSKKKNWLVYVKRACSLLIHLHQGTPLPRAFYNCFFKSLPVRPQSRLLTVTGINPSLDPATVRETITQLCHQHGGLYTDMFLSTTATNGDQPSVTGAVLELCSSEKCSVVIASLFSSLELQGEKKELSVISVFDNLTCEEEEGGPAKDLVQKYLQDKLNSSNGGLTDHVRTALSELFSSFTTSKERPSEETHGDTGLCPLFVKGVTGGSGSNQELLDQLAKQSRDEFLSWAEQQSKTDPVSLWRGLFAVGYDLRFVRCGFTPAEAVLCQPLFSQDGAMVVHVDAQCRRLSITSSQLQSWDIAITDTDLVSETLTPLQGLSQSDLRLKFLLLKHLNRQLSQVLPLVDLRSSHPLSLASRIRHVVPLLFYDVKISFLHNILNTATRRSLDQPPPEIKMDPLETVSGVSSSAASTQFCQAASQMLSVSSPQLCVSLASGGDPTYAFNVKLSGEEVHGTSGSFRHFLWQVVRELQSPVLPLLSPCPSSAAGINKGKHILTPRPMTYSEEKLLEFLGQLLGVAMRADVPVALDLLPCFWKSLKGEPLSISDLQEADFLTYSFTQQLLEAQDSSSFGKLASGVGQAVEENGGSQRSGLSRGLVFTHCTLAGVEEELCEGGATRPVRFEDREEYVTAVRRRRLQELTCEERMAAVRCGLGSVVPLQLLSLLTPTDLDMRVCGLPDIDLNYLKRHTTYHVGLMETDQHIQFFWKALTSFSQEELRKFIKFACNQERIPFGHPCREGGESLTHVPPYPMKIAPPDGSDQPDSRYIRAETCMFLVKLPQYSTQEIMMERLRYAINCREDPLSG